MVLTPGARGDGDAWTLRGGTVVDGTGAEPVRADVHVRDGVVVEIGPDLPVRGTAVPADGLVVTPGFVDMHAHADLALVAGTAPEAKLAQGVTTQVVGQDGIGYAPVDDVALAQVRRQIAGWNGDLPDVAWRSVGQYLDLLDRGVATHAAVLVPQGNLRLLTVGNDRRPATAPELDRMRGLLADALAEGAVGMSSGLTYAPGMYASTDELVALCEVVAAAGGYYSPHTRGYGTTALTSFAEMVEVARRSGCRLHLTHATMNFGVNAGRADELLAMLRQARADGVDVSIDTYPYLAGATTLGALLPGWASEGGPEATLARLADPAQRTRVAHALDVTGSDGAHGVPVDWTAIEVCGVGDRALADRVGRTIAEIAQHDGVPPVQAALDLVVADDLATGILMHVGHEENVRALMLDDRHCGGSDGIVVGPRPHPRAWGTFARYLGRYVRDLGVLSLAEAVRHLAGTPAQVLGLTDRGTVTPGARADLVLLDPATVTDHATYAEPRRPATGVHAVWLDGVLAHAEGQPPASGLGRALRAPGTSTGPS